MGSRSNRNRVPELLLEAFLLLPWWVGPPVAIFVFVGVMLLGRMLASGDNPFGRGIGTLFLGIALPAAVIVLIFWIISLIQKGSRRWLLCSREGIQSIRALSWRDFELLVGEALRRDGYIVEERGGGGADGGVDLVARRPGETMLVQCKHWRSWDVGVRIIREVFGVMTAERATSAMIVTTGRFSGPARSFAEGKPLRLLDGEELAAFVAVVQRTGSRHQGDDESSSSTSEPSPQEMARPDVASAPEFVCPKCGAPMVVRTARKGPNAGGQFLGCSTYPDCRGTRELRE